MAAKGAAAIKSARSGPVHEFAFVDVETTGLDDRVNRIIEIAIVIATSKGDVLHEWTTLVRPDVEPIEAGPTRIHLIESDWLRAAPTFSELAHDIAYRLNGRIIAAHNAEFDIGFLSAEFRRAGWDDQAQGNWLTMCTMQMARQLGVSSGLQSACYELGIRYDRHSALEDARACSQIMLRNLHRVAPETYQNVVPTNFGRPTPMPPGVPVVLRGTAAEVTRPRAVLADFIAALPARDDDGPIERPAVAAYREAVEGAIADGYVSQEEVVTLANLALSGGLSADDVQRVHMDVIHTLIETALHDRRISKAERVEITRAAAWLDVDLTEWDAFVAAAKLRIKAAAAEFAQELHGRVVAFTGSGLHTPSIREALATKCGFAYAERVTVDTALLVVGSAKTANAQVQKATELGVPTMIEPQFWRRLGE